MISQLPPSCFLNKNTICVGIAGYPNTGKSSIVKAIQSKFNQTKKSKILHDSNEIMIDYNVCLFDKLGLVISKNEVGPLMPKNVKNVEDLKEPVEIVKNVIKTLEHNYLLETFEIADFENVEEFLENIAKHKNFFVKKGYTDPGRAARHVIQTIIDGKLTYENKTE